MMRYWYDLFGSGMGVAGAVMMGFFYLLLIALIVVGIVAIARSSRRRTMMPPPGTFHPGAFQQGGFGVGGPQAGPANALHIASERYAKGEITEEEYLKIKENLSK